MSAESLPLFSNQRGDQYHQLWQHLPALKPFYTEFENNYDTSIGLAWCSSHWVVPITCVVVYLLGIHFGPKFMEKVPYDKIWELRSQLACWNAFLSIFSFIGALRTVPHVLYNLSSMPFEDTICLPSANDWGCGATGLWVQLFILSKIPELWDTFYIVARKRPLIFLHWYHHVTVLLYCWHAYSTEASQALYFVAMNYSVHAVMYGYYCLKALKITPPIPAWTITVAQISQMVVGTFIQLAAMYQYYKNPETCGVDFYNLVCGSIMYGSYFALFFQFFWNRFVVKARATAKAKAL